MARNGHSEQIRPWGAFPAPGLLRWVIGISAQLPADNTGRWLASLLYRLMGWRLGRPVDCLVHGFRTRLHAADNDQEAVALFTPQMYAVRQRKFLDSVVEADFSMLDIGANVGLLSLYAASRAGDLARVIAVESDPELFRRLRYNIGASGMSTVRASQMIITDEAGMIMVPRRFARFSAPSDDRGDDGASDNVAVPAESLAGLMDNYDLERVTVLRLGATGFEYDALSEFLTTVGRRRYPSVLMVRGNPDWPETDPARLARMHGYRVIDEGEEETILALSDIKASQMTESV